METIANRKVLIQALTGSYNYNLNTPESDVDWKYFVAPTFDDLYYKKMYSESKITETEDWSCHDIRKLPELFYKANINFLEVLFSDMILLNTEPNKKLTDLVKELFSMKDKIAIMNLPYLYDACVGMFYSKLGALKKGTGNTQHLIAKYGYCTKNAMHGWRVLDFLMRFADNGFKDFKQAIWYEDDELKKRYALSIKHGDYDLQTYLKTVDDKLVNVQMYYASAYKLHTLDTDTLDTLNEIVKEIVKVSINEQL